MSLLMRRRLLLSTTDNFQPAPPIHFMSADTAVLPFLGAGTYPHGAYVASLDKTFITWERVPSPHKSSVAAIMSYDHTANVWSTVYDIDTWSFVDDAHGQPAIVYGPDSHFYCLFGSHATTQLMSSSTNADDISKWNAVTSFGTTYTYPKPITVGSEIHCFWRKGVGGLNQTLVHRKGTPSAGSLTFGTETVVIDLDGGATDARVYATEVHKVGTALHFTACRQEAPGGSPRKHVYYFIYETTTGALSNIDGSTTVASGSLPINLTTANANFRIYEHTGSDVGILPSLQFDTSGNAHVTYAAGVADGLGRVQAYHMYWNGSAWSTPVTLAMLETNSSAVLVPGKKGRMEVWYPQDDGDAHLYGGSTMCRRKWNGVNWTAQEVMATASGSYPLDRPSVMRDSHPDIRVAFCEMIPSFDYTVADNLKRYAHGDRGYVIGPDPAVLQYAAAAGDDVLHLAVNDNSRIVDYTGNNCRPSGTTISGTEMVFNGTSARVVLSDSVAYTAPADWTLVFEGLKFSATSGVQTLIGHQQASAAGDKSWRVIYENSTDIALQQPGGLGNVLLYNWVPTISQSYDVAFERKGNTVYLYIDDLTAGNHVASAALSIAWTDISERLTIGAEYNTDIAGDYRRFFNGRMSKVRLVHSALYAA